MFKKAQKGNFSKIYQVTLIQCFLNRYFLRIMRSSVNTNAVVIVNDHWPAVISSAANDIEWQLYKKEFGTIQVYHKLHISDFQEDINGFKIYPMW